MGVWSILVERSRYQGREWVSHMVRLNANHEQLSFHMSVSILNLKIENNAFPPVSQPDFNVHLEPEGLAQILNEP